MHQTQSVRHGSILSDVSIYTGRGVEPELRGARPRRVVDTKFLREWRGACVNGMLGALFGALYLYTHINPLPNGLLSVCFLISGIFALVWAGHEYDAWCERKLLRYAGAARATVTRRDILLSGQYAVHMVTYTYRRPDGRTGTGRLSVREVVAESWGGLSVGKQFTVLLDPMNPVVAVPYFRIVYVAIPGATPAKATLTHLPDLVET